MADNVAITAGSGTSIATDDIGGVQYQRVKLSLGADGAATDIGIGQAAMAASVPVVIASNQTAIPITDNSGSLTVDGTVELGATSLAALETINANGVDAHDAVLSANPVLIGGRSSAAAPAAVSADGDAVRAWFLLNGAQATVLTAAGALIGGDATNGLDVDVTRVIPGTTATALGKARDSAIGATDTGVAMLGVRRDSPTAETPAAGDYVVPQVSQQGALYVHPTFSGSAGATVYSAISAATTNTANVKASAGVLTTVSAVNNSASWRYLKFHNTAGTPTAGSGVVATYGIPPGGGITLNFPSGLAFATGIGVSITGGIAAADTTAISASEVAVTLSYH